MKPNQGQVGKGLLASHVHVFDINLTYCKLHSQFKIQGYTHFWGRFVTVFQLLTFFN